QFRPIKGVHGALVEGVLRPKHQQGTWSQEWPKAQADVRGVVQGDDGVTKGSEEPNLILFGGEAPDAEGDVRLPGPGQKCDLIPPLSELGGQVAERRLRTAEWAFQGGCRVVVPTDEIQENDIHAVTGQDCSDG